MWIGAVFRLLRETLPGRRSRGRRGKGAAQSRARIARRTLAAAAGMRQPNASFSAALSHLVAVNSVSIKSGRVSARVSKTVNFLVHGWGLDLLCDGLRIG